MDNYNKVFKSMGINSLSNLHYQEHFNFLKEKRIILIIGAMGSGKTQYAASIYKDSKVLKNKNSTIKAEFSYKDYDRRNVFYVKNYLDSARFNTNKKNSLNYRGGSEDLEENRLKTVKEARDFKAIFKNNRDCGTFIIDEPGFYDERVVYYMLEEFKKRAGVFIFPTLILNFRREIFNKTVELLLEHASEVILLDAYCKNKNCTNNAFYSYRYYKINGEEAPALYFDPTIIVGGIANKVDAIMPGYDTRCEKHHHTPGKKYTYFKLKPLLKYDREGFYKEMEAIKNNIEKSKLYNMFLETYEQNKNRDLFFNSLKLPYIAEKIISFSYIEMNLLNEDDVLFYTKRARFRRKILKKYFRNKWKACKF